jgi:acetylornithine aminotransferase
VLDRDVAPVVDACREEGLLVLTAGAPPALRLLPPLVVSEAEVEQALAILGDVLR